MVILHHTRELGDVVVISRTETTLKLRITLPSGVICRPTGNLEGKTLHTNVGDLILSPEDIKNLQKIFKQ